MGFGDGASGLEGLGMCGAYDGGSFAGSPSHTLPPKKPESALGPAPYCHLGPEPFNFRQKPEPSFGVWVFHGNASLGLGLDFFK